MLPTALADGADQQQLSRVRVRIAVIRLVRILSRIVGVHEVRHGAPVDDEVSGMVRLGLNIKAASRSTRTGGVCSSDSSRASRRGYRDLRLCLAVNPGIHLGPLEEVL